MRREKVWKIVLIGFAMVFAMAGESNTAQAQEVKTKYPSMAPVEQYLMMDRNAEIALARSAAPESITQCRGDGARAHGYEVAVKGTNGFVCIVERGWTAGIDFPDFWNPKLRGPLCSQPGGVREPICH